jgi:hypothetical protein
LSGFVGWGRPTGVRDSHEGAKQSANRHARIDQEIAPVSGNRQPPGALILAPPPAPNVIPTCSAASACRFGHMGPAAAASPASSWGEVRARKWSAWPAHEYTASASLAAYSWHPPPAAAAPPPPLPPPSPAPGGISASAPPLPPCASAVAAAAAESREGSGAAPAPATQARSQPSPPSRSEVTRVRRRSNGVRGGQATRTCLRARARCGGDEGRDGRRVAAATRMVGEHSQ